MDFKSSGFRNTVKSGILTAKNNALREALSNGAAEDKIDFTDRWDRLPKEKQEEFIDKRADFARLAEIDL